MTPSNTANHSSLKRKASFANINEEETLSRLSSSCSSSRIFDLPPVLFHIIFGSYLSIHNICRFDKALCNHIDRPRYFSLLNGMTISHHFYVRSSAELAWIHNRQLRLENVSWGFNINTEDLCTLYPLHWSSIKKWDFSKGTPSADARSIVACLLQCTSLESLECDVPTSFNNGDAKFKEIFDEDYVDTLLSIFDHPEFCAHLRDIYLRISTHPPFIPINKAAVAISKHCHNLVRIEFGNEHTSSEVIVQFLSKCGATLQEFSFYNCKRYSDSDYKRIIEYCPRLTAIKIHVASDSDAFMSEIGRCYPDLLSLTLYDHDNRDVNDGNLQSQLHMQGLFALFEGCRKLQSLNIVNSFKKLSETLSEAVLIRALECCRDLRHFRLLSVPITARVLFTLSTNCSQLEELSLNGRIITESHENLLYFNEQCNFPNLHSLDCGSIEINDRLILEFVQKSPLLRNLDISCSPYITDVGMHHIATHCRNLSRICIRHLSGVSTPDNLIKILINNPNIRKSGFHFFGYASSYSSILVDNPYNHLNGKQEFTTELQALLNSRAYII